MKIIREPDADLDIRYVLSDLDETVITDISWHMLLNAAGIDHNPIVAKYEPMLRQAETDDDEDALLERWVQENAVQLAGESADVSDKIRICYTPGVEDFFRDLSAYYTSGLVAGGTSVVGDMVMADLLLNESHCNKVYTDSEGNFLPKSECLTRWNDKLKYIQREIVKEHLAGDVYFISDGENDRDDPIAQGIVVSEGVVFLGDGENDIEPLEGAAIGIAMNPKTDEVRDAANVVVSNFFEARKYLEQRGIMFDKTRLSD